MADRKHREVGCGREKTDDVEGGEEMGEESGGEGL